MPKAKAAAEPRPQPTSDPSLAFANPHSSLDLAAEWLEPGERIGKEGAERGQDFRGRSSGWDSAPAPGGWGAEDGGVAVLPQHSLVLDLHSSGCT